MKMKKIIISITISLAIVVVLAFLFVRNIYRLTIENADLFQYLSGNKVTYIGDVSISRDENGTILNNNGKTFAMESDPIYYRKENKFILPKDMAIVDYKTGQMNKINHYSEIYGKDGDIYLGMNNKENIIKNSFLFDGEDTYVFLDNVNLVIGDLKYTITPFSYITFRENELAYIFVHGSDNFYDESQVEGKGIVESEEYGIYVDLGSDSINFNDTKQLLFKNVEQLPNFN
ncbi:MAG: hypothetical protein ACRCZK_00780 [Oscillospiraceae bacterium]